jgi:hypothetical protein
MIMTAVMREVRNTFWDGYSVTGGFEAVKGRIYLGGGFAVGSHVCLRGSGGFFVAKLDKFNRNRTPGVFRVKGMSDGLYTNVYRLNVPDDFIQLVAEIEKYINASPRSNVVSEQFGGYRYTVEGGRGGWESVFSKALNRYRRMRDPLLEDLIVG